MIPMGMNDSLQHSTCDMQVFYAQGIISATSDSWQIWRKPVNCSQVFIFVQAAGGAGGSGHTRAAGVAGGGGGGGGSGGVTTLYIPACFLPDNLYIRPAVGGSPGVTGQISYVSTTSESTNGRFLIAQAAGSNGGNGALASVGAAGTAGAAMTVTNSISIRGGVFVTTGGTAGGAGGAVAGGTPAGISSNGNSGNLTTGGAGGAGCTTTDFPGAAVTVSYASFGGPSGNLTIAGGTAAGGAGNHGFKAGCPMGIGGLILPQGFSGGTGGGSNNSATAGAGGAGSWGSGGGGGGAGTTGGAGGRGGNGFVIITSR